MTVTELIEETREELAIAREELELLEMQLYDKRLLIQRLQDELHGLTLNAERRGELVVEAHDKSNVVPINGASVSRIDMPDLSGYSRTDAVVAVMEAEARALDRASIYDLMVLSGADIESADQVSLALTNLKRSGRVQKLGDGRWRLVHQSLRTGQ